MVLSARADISGEMAYAQHCRRSVTVDSTTLLFIRGRLPSPGSTAHCLEEDRMRDLSSGPRFRFLLDLFPDLLGYLQAAQIKISKLPREEFYLFVILEVLVNDDPAGLQHPACPALRRLEVVVGNLD